jgi:hypothetical protein
MGSALVLQHSRGGLWRPSLPEEPNYFAQAFKSQYNVIGLATALGFAVVSGTWLPILVAAGVEMMILPLVSGNERFRRLVKARESQEKVEEKEQRQQHEVAEMLRFLPDQERVRYRQLEQQAQEIRQNYAALNETSRLLVDDLESKLGFLLGFYLRTRHSLARYQRYFATTDPERMQERIAMLTHEIEQGTARVKEVKTRTKAVLEKRMERYQKALENMNLVDAQTETVQEVLQLLRDQSYSMRDPRSITDQLDGLLSSAEETERGVRDMEELLSLDPDGLLGSGLEGLEDELTAAPAAAPRAVTAPSLPVPTTPMTPTPKRKKVVQ